MITFSCDKCDYQTWVRGSLSWNKEGRHIEIYTNLSEVLNLDGINYVCIDGNYWLLCDKHTKEWNQVSLKLKQKQNEELKEWLSSTTENGGK